MTLTWTPQTAMSEQEIDNFLNQKLIFRFTSIRPDGYPHTTPLWYLWDGQAIWFVLGSGERPRQHIRNLRRNPKVCVVIDRDVRPEQGGVFGPEGVTIRGIAELFTEEKLQKEMATKILNKVLGEEGNLYVTPVLKDGKPGNNRVVTKVTPEKIYGWDLHNCSDRATFGLRRP